MRPFLDLMILNGVNALALVGVLWPAAGPLRVLSLPVVLLSPGYALWAFLDSQFEVLDWSERLAIGFGVSVAVSTLAMLLLNYTNWGVTAVSAVSALAVATAALSAGVAVRRLGRFGAFVAANAQRPSGRRFQWSTSLALLLITLSLVAGAAVYRQLPASGFPERYTEFYLLGPEGAAQDYPAAVVLGSSATATIGIVNHQGRESTFTVDIQDDTRLLTEAGPIRLRNNERWEHTVAFKPSEPGVRRVQFVLKSDGHVVDQPLHLWLTVTKP